MESKCKMIRKDWPTTMISLLGWWAVMSELGWVVVKQVSWAETSGKGPWAGLGRNKSKDVSQDNQEGVLERAEWLEDLICATRVGDNKLGQASTRIGPKWVSRRPGPGYTEQVRWFGWVDRRQRPDQGGLHWAEPNWAWEPTGDEGEGELGNNSHTADEDTMIPLTWKTGNRMMTNGAPAENNTHPYKPSCQKNWKWHSSTTNTHPWRRNSERWKTR